jgi:hypothetical protein
MTITGEATVGSKIEFITKERPSEETMYCCLLSIRNGWGRNLVWQIDLRTGSFSTLVAFPNIPNPFFPALGPPSSEAVPTGIAVSGDHLLVSLFTGVPFAPGTSSVERVDPSTGSHAAFISGLKTAIDVLPIRAGSNINYLVLQHASIGPFFGGPGLVLHFETPGGSPSVVADCLTRPTSMTLYQKTGTLYAYHNHSPRMVSAGLAEAARDAGRTQPSSAAAGKRSRASP